MIKQIEIIYGKRCVEVEVRFKSVKDLAITVHPNLKVTAKAPLDSDETEIQRRLQKRGAWIVKQLAYFEEFQPKQPPRKYVSGETHYYLGRQYRLRIRKGETAKVKLKGRFFEMTLPKPKDAMLAKQVMQAWYTEHARNLLRYKAQAMIPAFVRLGAQEPEIRFRRMQKRWGSYSSSGVVTLNTELVKTPIHCIEYVIVHELCHLLCQHHDRRFFRLLSRFLPDWERRKERLEKSEVFA